MSPIRCSHRADNLSLLVAVAVNSTIVTLSIIGYLAYNSCTMHNNRWYIQVYDSIDNHINEYVAVQLAQCYRMHNLLNITLIGSQQQTGVVDCGLFCIARATDMALGFASIGNDAGICYNQATIRKFFMRCLRHGSLERFPTVSSPNIVISSNNPMSFELICICRLPVCCTDITVICDGCNEMFHSNCVANELENQLQNSDTWFCENCENWIKLRMGKIELTFIFFYF